MDTDMVSWIFWIATAVFLMGGGLMLWVRRLMRRDLHARKLAFEAPHERRVRAAADFPGVDLAMYDQLQAELDAAGFAFLGDVEDLTLARTHIGPGSPARYMVSSDGVVTAMLLQFRPSATARVLLASRGIRTFFIVAMQTRFANGNIFLLTRCDQNTFIAEAPLVISDTIDPASSVTDMVDAVHKFLNGHPELVPVPIRNLDDLLECECYIDQLRREYRLKVGLVTQADLIREGYSPEVAAAQIARIDKMLAGDPVWDPALRHSAPSNRR